MDSKKAGTKGKDSVQPPKKDAVSGQNTDKTVVRPAKRQEQPLDERRVISKQEDTAKYGKEPVKELDWALAKRNGRSGKETAEPRDENNRQGGRNRRELTKAEERLRNFGRVGQWFQILCFMHIPVFGFLYMLVTALRKKTPPQKKSFAIAYILYRILVLLLAGTILYILYKVGLGFVEEILRYAHF